MAHFKWNIVFVILITIFYFTGCKTMTQQAGLRTEEIIIDGNYSDWLGSLNVQDDLLFSTGFQYDQDYFYLCLITRNEQIKRQIMKQGLILWLDSKSDKMKRMGIKFPLGLIESGLMQRNMNELGNPTQDPEIIAGMFERSLHELEIFLPDGNDFHSVYRTDLIQYDVAINIAMKDEAMVYELKIPLLQNENHLYAISDQDVSSIKVELQTPEFDRDTMRGSNKMGSGFRGAGSMGGRGGGLRRGGIERGMRPDRPEPLNLSFKVVFE
ncbi:hypothetical protein ACFL4L_05670 [bacterium]